MRGFIEGENRLQATMFPERLDDCIIEAQLLKAPDQQIALTDPDARIMATGGRSSVMVGYNVQSAVDNENHLIVDHEVTNIGNDRAQLSKMALDTASALC